MTDDKSARAFLVNVADEMDWPGIAREIRAERAASVPIAIVIAALRKAMKS